MPEDRGRGFYLKVANDETVIFDNKVDVLNTHCLHYVAEFSICVKI